MSRFAAAPFGLVTKGEPQDRNFFISDLQCSLILEEYFTWSSAKCFSFRNCHVISAGSESCVVSNYSQHYEEGRPGKIKLINFDIFH